MDVSLLQGKDRSAFGFADANDTMGAPFFAHFAKGGNHEGVHVVFGDQRNFLSAASHPTLAKDARMGHPVVVGCFVLTSMLIP